MVIEGREATTHFRKRMLLVGLRGEIRGMRLTGKAPTCYSLIKREFGLKGSRTEVLAQFEALLEQQGVEFARKK